MSKKYYVSIETSEVSKEELIKLVNAVIVESLDNLIELVENKKTKRLDIYENAFFVDYSVSFVRSIERLNERLLDDKLAKEYYKLVKVFTKLIDNESSFYVFRLRNLYLIDSIASFEDSKLFYRRALAYLFDNKDSTTSIRFFTIEDENEED